MEITSVKLACFSPTGTTRAVLRGIAEGLGSTNAELVDLTAPEVRERALRAAEGELLVVGAPVYMGRIPALLGTWLERLDLQGAPVVCVVVYGNRAYEDALLELKDRIAERGGVPVACGAFIGEHSFSAPEFPTAQGRPDQDDLERAVAFGRSVRAKLDAAPSAPELPEGAVPGARPYGGRTELWSVDFIAVDENCLQCGLCAEVCPVGAVDPDDSARIDQEKCITCCACIKRCPQQARSMKPGPVMDARERLNRLFHERREPELFL